MDVSEQELEHIKELLFTGDSANIMLVKAILSKRVKRQELDDFYEKHIFPPCLRLLRVATLGVNPLKKMSRFFSVEIWDYQDFFELLRNSHREWVFLGLGKQIFNDILEFNLKCQKCKLIYFPCDIPEEFFSLVVKEKRPDIKVIINP